MIVTVPIGIYTIGLTARLECSPYSNEIFNHIVPCFESVVSCPVEIIRNVTVTVIPSWHPASCYFKI